VPHDEFATTGPLAQQAAWLLDYRPRLRISERGSVVSVGDGITWIAGLPSAAMDDILEFEDGSRGMVFDLTGERVGAVLLHETDALRSGTPVHLTGRRLSLPVGDALLGRVIDPLGTPLDDRPAPRPTAWQYLEAPSPPIVARDFVHSPLYTGIKIIDTLIPIGACVEDSGFDTSPFLARAIDAYTWQGVQWAMPFNVSNPVLYYLRPKFEAAGLDPDVSPITLEDIRSTSQQIVDADAALDRDRNPNDRPHGLHAFGDERGLRHETCAETPALHAIARTADVQVDLVVALRLAEASRAGEQPGIGTAELQRDRVFRRIEAEQPFDVTVCQRLRRHHLRVQQRPRAQQPQQVAAVPIRVVHHRGHGDASPDHVRAVSSTSQSTTARRASASAAPPRMASS